MSQRYLDDEQEMQRLIHNEMTTDELAREMKIYYNFVPTDDIMGLLTKRMIQLSDQKKEKNIDVAKELWSGFHPVDREGGKVTYHPDTLLEPFMINGRSD